jgi:hypothetical protein
VNEDSYVVNTMLEHNMPLPVSITDKRKKAEAAATVDPLEALQRELGEDSQSLKPSRSVMSSDMSVRSLRSVYTSNSVVSESTQKRWDTLLEAYETAVCTVSGAFVRFNLLHRAVEAIISCRRISLLRVMWPPAARRIDMKFMMPRAGLLTPKFDLPPQRIKLFPSRRPEAYTRQEIMTWGYSGAGMDPDDAAMLKAEAEGVRMRCIIP